MLKRTVKVLNAEDIRLLREALCMETVSEFPPSATPQPLPNTCNFELDENAVFESYEMDQETAHVDISTDSQTPRCFRVPAVVNRKQQVQLQHETSTKTIKGASSADRNSFVDAETIKRKRKPRTCKGCLREDCAGKL